MYILYRYYPVGALSEPAFPENKKSELKVYKFQQLFTESLSKYLLLIILK